MSVGGGEGEATCIVCTPKKYSRTYSFSVFILEVAVKLHHYTKIHSKVVLKYFSMEQRLATASLSWISEVDFLIILQKICLVFKRNT